MVDPTLAGFAVLTLGAAAGALVQAVTGFGFAILAAPVFLWVLGSTTAIPILVALHVVQSAMLVPGVLAHAPRDELARLGAGALVGAPLGFLALGALEVRQLKIAAGLAILAVAALMAWRRRKPPVRLDTGEDTAHAALGAASAASVATGAASGALTALLVMPGPPLMVHLMRRPILPETARALSLTFFGACYVGVLAMSLAAGQLAARDIMLVALLSAPVALATVAGRRLGPRLLGRHFVAVLNVLLVLAGLGALASAL
jgi:uncharacterized membrane protein YfcA